MVLVRHGESTWIAEGRFQGRGDPPLSTRGERQAALVGARLARPLEPPPLPVPPGPPLAVWHSPLRRAAQTATAIRSGWGDGVPARPIDGLMEIDQGAWEGRLRGDVELSDGSRLAAWRRDPMHHHAPQGESLRQVDRRVRSTVPQLIQQLAEARDPSWGIVVAHEGLFRILLARLLGGGLPAFWSFPFDLCAVSVLQVEDGRIALLAHNRIEHLAPLAADPAARREMRGERGGAL